MDIIYYSSADPLATNIISLQQALPKATIRQWQPGDTAHADYALVWKPPPEMLAGRERLKAIFNLGAGVDALLQMAQHIPANVPLYRLEDAGMGEQMADYVSLAVLGYFRRMDDYRQLARLALWQPKPANHKADFKIAVLGLGVLGRVIVERLQALNFPVVGWSRTPKNIAGAECYSGEAGLQSCLSKATVVVCILPLTPETEGLLNRTRLMYLPPGGYVINVGRGAQLVENDLLELLHSGHLAGATLDVVQTEPLAPQHPFWREPKITITPHVSALTLMDQSQAQLVEKIQQLELGLPVSGLIDRSKGY